MAGSTVLAGDYTSLLHQARGMMLFIWTRPIRVTNVSDHRYIAGLLRQEFEKELLLAVKAGTSFIISYDAITDDNSTANRSVLRSVWRTFTWTRAVRHRPHLAAAIPRLLRASTSHLPR